MFTVSNVLINGNHATEGQLIHIQGDVIHKDGFHKQTRVRVYCNGSLLYTKSIDTEVVGEDAFHFVIPVNQLVELKDPTGTYAFSLFLDHNEPVKPVWRTTVYLDDPKLEQILNYGRNVQGFESLLKAVNTLQRLGVNLVMTELRKGDSKVLVKGKFFGVEHELSINKTGNTPHWVWKRDGEELVIPDEPHALMFAIGRHFHPCELIAGKEAYPFASFIFHELGSHQDDGVRERFANVCQRTALQQTSIQNFDSMYTRLMREPSGKENKSRMSTVPGLYAKNWEAHFARLEAKNYNDL